MNAPSPKSAGEKLEELKNQNNPGFEILRAETTPNGATSVCFLGVHNRLGSFGSAEFQGITVADVAENYNLIHFPNVNAAYAPEAIFSDGRQTLRLVSGKIVEGKDRERHAAFPAGRVAVYFPDLNCRLGGDIIATMEEVRMGLANRIGAQAVRDDTRNQPTFPVPSGM